MSARFVVRFLGLFASAFLRLVGRVLRTRVGFIGLALCGVLFGVRSCGDGDALRVGTFNIQEFGQETNLPRLLALLTEANRDVLALQEIQDLALLNVLSEKLSASSGHKYQAIASQCGGKSRMHVGFLYDSERVRLDGAREFPELLDDRSGSCSAGARAGLLATFSTRRWFSRKAYSLLVVHFPALGTEERAQERRVFWQRALKITQQLRTDGAERVLLLGDVNSTGYLDNSHEERDNIHRYAKRAGFQVLTPGLGCTAYYQPAGQATYTASHLDHVVASNGVEIVSEPRTLSFCQALQCRPAARMPSDFAEVSDHCPVIIDLR